MRWSTSAKCTAGAAIETQATRDLKPVVSHVSLRLASHYVDLLAQQVKRWNIQILDEVNTWNPIVWEHSVAEMLMQNIQHLVENFYSIVFVHPKLRSGLLHQLQQHTFDLVVERSLIEPNAEIPLIHSF